MKILIDMNLSPDWVSFLIENGFQATHWSTLGPPSADDSTIMQYASERHFVVLTHDLDFGMLLAIGKAKTPSVIQVRVQDVLPDSMGTLILKSLAETEVHLEAGALVTVEPHRLRIRVLPI